MAIDRKPWQMLLYEIWASVTEGHAFEVEPLSITENGTYTAEEGKAYSPVTVNVAGGTEYGAMKDITFEVNGTPTNIGLTIMTEEGLMRTGTMIAQAASSPLGEYVVAAGAVIAFDANMSTDTATMTIDGGDPQSLRLIVDEEYEMNYFVFTVPSEGESIVIDMTSE